MKINAYAAQDAKSKLEPFQYELDALEPGQVDIEVTYCGICHSDLSMIDGEWGNSEYPLVPGHEIIGKIVATGDHVTQLKAGQTVGLGWFARSCMTCHPCMSGDHNLCSNTEQTIVGRHGGFASHVRCHESWAIPLPDKLDTSAAGPLFCGGITVFNPIIQNNLSSTSKVGVIGIGGLGHLALQFLNAWGCEVTAFSTSPEKESEAKDLGAHHFVNTKADNAFDGLDGRFNLILVTTDAALDWNPYLQMLAPRGVLHFVGAVPKIETGAMALIMGQKSISGSPLGSPAIIRTMLEFCALHNISPKVETFPMSKVNTALNKLRDKQPASRLVLKADFK